jgi:O-antigen ligase
VAARPLFGESSQRGPSGPFVRHAHQGVGLFAALAGLALWMPHVVVSALCVLALVCALAGGLFVRQDRRAWHAHQHLSDRALGWALGALGLWGALRVGITLGQQQPISWPGVGHFVALFPAFWLARRVPSAVARAASPLLVAGLSMIMLMFVLVLSFGPLSPRVFLAYNVYVGNDSIVLGELLAVLASVSLVRSLQAALSGVWRIAIIWGLFAIPAVAVLLVVGMSRSAFLVFAGAVVLGGLACCRTPLQRLLTLLALAALFAGVFAASDTLRTRVITAVDEVRNAVTEYDVKTSQGQRLALNSVTLRAIAERPWVGHGLGAWRTQFSRLVPQQWQTSIAQHTSPHNEYFHIAAQLGWIGAVLYGLVCVAILGVGVHSVRVGQPPWLLAIGTMLVIGSATNVMLWDFRFWSFTAAMLTLALAQRYAMLRVPQRF